MHRGPPRPAWLQDTYDIWQEAIAYCKPGRHYKGIGGVIEDLCTAKGYTTVPNFCEWRLHSPSTKEIICRKCC